MADSNYMITIPNTLTCNISALSTEKKQLNLPMRCIKDCSGGKVGTYGICYNLDVFNINDIKYWQPEHLYLTTTEDIQEGDLVSHSNGVKRLIGRYTKLSKTYDETNCIAISPRTKPRKILATTDTSLGLPLLPLHLVQKFVDRKGRIDEVLLELEDKSNNPKRTSDNYVIVAPSKALWTTEEVIELCEEAYGKGVKKGQLIGQLPTPRVSFREWVRSKFY